MATHGRFVIDVGFQVYLSEGGEEIGAVRFVEDDHIVVYIEGATDFVVLPDAVHAAHHGKVILDPEKADPALLEAAEHAHERETD